MKRVVVFIILLVCTHGCKNNTEPGEAPSISPDDVIDHWWAAPDDSVFGFILSTNNAALLPVEVGDDVPRGDIWQWFEAGLLGLPTCLQFHDSVWWLVGITENSVALKAHWTVGDRITEELYTFETDNDCSIGFVLVRVGENGELSRSCFELTSYPDCD